MKAYKPTQEEIRLCESINYKFKKAYVSKAPLMVDWKKYMRAYTGEMFRDESKPDYKSNQISNFIFSVIETIRPIMVDNNPKFLALPATPEGGEVSSTVQMALDHEWDREKMNSKLVKQLIPTLVTGNSVWFIPWDAENQEVKCMCVDPMNIFQDPMAESVEDAEYIIYATYKSENELKKFYPDKEEALIGSQVNFSELVNERDKNVIDNSDQILVLECWMRDYSTIMDEEKKKRKYPKGRVVVCCPDLGIVLDDKPNPYNDGKFPFVIMKDYDMPYEFWGKGEVEQLISPQEYINELSNQIIDTAKTTANMPWIIDKNSGIGYGKLTNRPGLVIRKNPGTQVGREQPPALPMYVSEKILDLKNDIEQISGVHDTMRGDKEKGIVAGNAIMALQEASQARVRMKIKIMEECLSEIANMWYRRMQQFWKVDRWVRVTDIEGNVNFEKVGKDVLANNYDVKIASGSTMPTNKSATLDLLIRLAQTMGEDGLPMVDRKAVLEFVPIADRKAVNDRLLQVKQTQEQLAQSQQQNAQSQQQIDALNNEKMELTNMIQELGGIVSDLNTEVAKIQHEQENYKEKEKIKNIEDKSFERGVKHGMQEKNKEKKEVTPQNDPIESPIEPMQEDPNMINPMEEAMPLEEQIEGEMPMGTEADEEIPQLSDELLAQIAGLSDEELIQLLEAFPELADILQQQQIGGM